MQLVSVADGCSLPGRGNSGILIRHWQLANALARRCEQRVRQRRHDARGGGLADAAGRLAAVDEVYLDRRHLVHAEYAAATCGEEDPEKLPSFSAPQHEGVRVEACESRKYVKSIERWTQGAEIDDLVALSLDPWATSQGYQRLEPGLAGL